MTSVHGPASRVYHYRINAQVRRALDADADRVGCDETLGLLLGSRGPLWYLGYFMAGKGYEQATTEDVRAVLEQFGAGRLVVAHTAVESVESRYGGLVIGIHVRMGADTLAEGLLWAEERLYRVDAAGRREALSLDEPS